MLPPNTIQKDLVDWVNSPKDSKTKWNMLKQEWATFAKNRKMYNPENAIYEVVLQVNQLDFLNVERPPIPNG